MTRKLLQVCGALALVLWTGGGLVAWKMAKDQVRVTLSTGTEVPAQKDDPVALLRDEVGTLGRDVQTLHEATRKGLEGLAAGLGEDADHRDRALEAAVTRLATAITALEARVAGQERAMTRSLAELHTVAESRPAQVAAAPGVEEQHPVAAQPGSMPASVPPSPPTPRKKRSFLAFDLAANEFRFDQRQRYEILPSLSRVGFDAKSTLHDFTGVSSAVSGTVVADLAHPETNPEGRIVVEAKTLVSGLEGRDAAMREHLATDQHATIRFELETFTADRIDAGKLSVAGKATGRLTIRGKTQPLTLPVTLTIDEARRLCIEGEAPLRLPEFGIEVPSKLGLIKMDDQVRIWLALRLRGAGKVD